MTFRLLSACVAWVLLVPVANASAQADQSRAMGTVTDASGGALPGVTVTLSGSMPSTSVVTDGSGRYLTGWMVPGDYSITFVLSGFDTRRVNRVSLGAGQTVVLDQQLPLAALSEIVEVKAPAPVPPPPVAAPPPPRPRAKPVDKDIVASVCGPRQPPDYSLSIGRVVSHRDESGRQLLGPGDYVRIDAGEKQGVTVGDNLVVRRRFHTGDPFAAKKLQTFGEQTAGLVQIMEISRESSVGFVVYACGEIFAGDVIERYVSQPAFFAVAAGQPQFDEPAKITIGEHNSKVAGGGQMMVIDHGIMQGVQRGQLLTIFRRPAGMEGAPLTIGAGVIVAVRPDSATIRIEKATDAVTIGDMVALHR
jgi:hypothetical protein